VIFLGGLRGIIVTRKFDALLRTNGGSGSQKEQKLGGQNINRKILEP
jgi:hypothetical protein